MMPGKRTFELDEFYILPVQLTGDSGIPIVIEEGEFVFEVDFVHCQLVLGLWPWVFGLWLFGS